MRPSLCIAALLIGMLATQPLAAQSSNQSSNPVADAFRHNAGEASRNLVAALETMPADKFGYKPTPAQMSVGQIATHLAEGNDYLCGTISGLKAPKRAEVADTASKDSLMALVRETFAFCDQALTRLDDSRLGEELPFFGGRKMTRAAIMTITTADWADHYSQLANYLRLNDLLPPTAKQKEE
jgi:uncharacterized damage-inducible protein DinB